MYQPWLDEGFARPGARRTRADFEIAATCHLQIVANAEAKQMVIDAIKPSVSLYMGGMGAAEANFHNQVFVRMGYEDLADEVQELYLDRREGQGHRADPRRARRRHAHHRQPSEVKERVAAVGGDRRDDADAQLPLGRRDPPGRGAAGLSGYEGRRVVVTGAATGVGAALVERLRAAGAASITGVDRKPVSGVDTFHEVDLSDRAAVEQLAVALDGQVDVLFNNAGVAANLPTRVVDGRQRAGAAAAGRRPGRLAWDAGGASSGRRRWPACSEANHLAEIDRGARHGRLGRSSRAFVDGREDLARDTYAFSKECAQVVHDAGVGVGRPHGVRINSVCPGIIETPLITDFAATLGLPIMQWMTDQGAGRRARRDEIAGVAAVPRARRQLDLA